MKNLYEILGVENTATTEEIKKAYREQSKTLHPDGGGNEEDFKELKNAYDILIDPEIRSFYDVTGDVNKIEFDKRFKGFVDNVVIPTIEACQNVNDVNILDQIMAAIIETKKMIIKDKRKINSKILKLESVLDNLVSKNNCDDILRNSLKQRISTDKRKIELHDNTLNFVENCQTIMNGYEYHFKRNVKTANFIESPEIKEWTRVEVILTQSEQF